MYDRLSRSLVHDLVRVDLMKSMTGMSVGATSSCGPRCDVMWTSESPPSNNSLLLSVDVPLTPATYELGVSCRIAARDSMNWKSAERSRRPPRHLSSFS